MMMAYSGCIRVLSPPQLLQFYVRRTIFYSGRSRQVEKFSLSGQHLAAIITDGPAHSTRCF